MVGSRRQRSGKVAERKNTGVAKNPVNHFVPQARPDPPMNCPAAHVDPFLPLHEKCEKRGIECRVHRIRVSTTPSCRQLEAICRLPWNVKSPTRQDMALIRALNMNLPRDHRRAQQSDLQEILFFNGRSKLAMVDRHPIITETTSDDIEFGLAR